MESASWTADQLKLPLSLYCQLLSSAPGRYRRAHQIRSPHAECGGNNASQRRQPRFRRHFFRSNEKVVSPIFTISLITKGAANRYMKEASLATKWWLTTTRHRAATKNAQPHCIFAKIDDQETPDWKQKC